jgi:hypothetical protein
VLRRLDAIDDLLRSSRSRKAPLATREATVVEFPRFNGTHDPLRWIHHCECYFHAHQTLKNRRTQPSIYSTTLNCCTIGSPTTQPHPPGSNLYCSSSLDSGHNLLTSYSAHRHLAVTRWLERAWVTMVSYLRSLAQTMMHCT